METTSPARLIEYVPLDEVEVAERNAREHDLPKLIESIRTFGFTIPLLPDGRTGRLVAGHGRLEALRQMRDAADPPPDGVDAADGMWRVPVIRGWSSRDDDHAKAVAVADNRLSEIGGWDDNTLAELLEEIVDVDPGLLDITGFTATDLDNLLRDIGAYADRTANYFDGAASGDDDDEDQDDEETEEDAGDTTTGDGGLEFVQVSWVVNVDQRKTIRKALTRAQKLFGLDTSAIALYAIADHFLTAHPEQETSR